MSETKAVGGRWFLCLNNERNLEGPIVEENEVIEVRSEQLSSSNVFIDYRPLVDYVAEQLVG